MNRSQISPFLWNPHALYKDKWIYKQSWSDHPEVDRRIFWLFWGYEVCAERLAMSLPRLWGELYCCSSCWYIASWSLASTISRIMNCENMKGTFVCSPRHKSSDPELRAHHWTMGTSTVLCLNLWTDSPISGMLSLLLTGNCVHQNIYGHCRHREWEPRVCELYFSSLPFFPEFLLLLLFRVMGTFMGPDLYIYYWEQMWKSFLKCSCANIDLLPPVRLPTWSCNCLAKAGAKVSFLNWTSSLNQELSATIPSSWNVTRTQELK